MDRPWRRSSYSCQILDKIVPTYSLSLSYLPNSDFEGAGDTDMIEMRAAWEFAYFRNVLGGDMDLHAEFEDTVFPSGAGVNMPSQAGIVALDAGWTWRYANGVSLQTRLAPGFYTDMDESGSDAFSMPVSVMVIRSFNRHISGLAGLEYRADFDTVVIPIFGIEWEISEMFRVEARIPESRLVCYMNPDWTAYGTFAWRNTSFMLEDSREMMTLEDFRTTFGLSYRLSDTFMLAGELGRAFNRSVEFDEGGRETDIDRTLFLRVGISGPF
jgi:hypothetical protein